MFRLVKLLFKIGSEVAKNPDQWMDNKNQENQNEADSLRILRKFQLDLRNMRELKKEKFYAKPEKITKKEENNRDPFWKKWIEEKKKWMNDPEPPEEKTNKDIEDEIAKIFCKEYTAAVEDKQVAYQEAQRAVLFVEGPNVLASK